MSEEKFLKNDNLSKANHLNNQFESVFTKEDTRSRGYKTFSMLNLAEHEIYPAHKLSAF